ncbi:hypothetical protein [Streptosporangium sp. KLBMP 9127]|nr:hypothetical protein [Streptosporangium sp. KLBMP 9127]
MDQSFGVNLSSLETGSGRLAQQAEQCQAVSRQLATQGLGGSWGTDGLIAPFVTAFVECVQAGARAVSVNGAALDTTGSGLRDTVATTGAADAAARSAVEAPGTAS